MEKNQILVKFLRELANKIEGGLLNNENLERIGKFFMEYKYRNKIVENSDDELINFLVLGWYIYTYFLI